MYSAHRYIGFCVIDQTSSDPRILYIRSIRWLLLANVLLGMGVCFYIVSGWELNLIKLILWALPFGAAYVFPVSKAGRRLRDFAYIKIFLIAAIWTYLCVAIPFDNSWTLSSGLTYVASVLFLFGITLPFDIRDKDIDARRGVKTFASVWDRKDAWMVSSLLMVLYICIQILTTIVISSKYAVFIATGGGLLCIFAIRKKWEREELYYSFCIESSLLWPSVLYVLGSLLMSP